MTDTKRLLADICQEYFDITPRIAQRKASMGLLPVPAFRLTGTRKGPLCGVIPTLSLLMLWLGLGIKYELYKAR